MRKDTEAPELKASPAPRKPSQARKHLGNQGEALARGYLETEKGLRFVAANWRLGRTGELDLVMSLPEARLLVFVEVKTRKRAGWDEALAAVNEAKCLQLLQLGEGFLATHPEFQDWGCRFDVVAVQWLSQGGTPAITHVENAIQQDG